MTEAKLCECGCGQPAPIARKTSTFHRTVKGQPLRFIQGHNARLTTAKEYPRKFCECGCGQETARPKYRPPQRFISGHNAKGRRKPLWFMIQDCGYATPCWVWMCARSPEGYARYGRHGYGHRAVYEALRGPIPEGFELDHLCRNRACVNPDHLEAVTHVENVRRGPLVRLTVADVEEIRASTQRSVDLAKKYGVDRSHIGKIRRNRKCWIVR